MGTEISPNEYAYFGSRSGQFAHLKSARADIVNTGRSSVTARTSTTSPQEIGRCTREHGIASRTKMEQRRD